MPILSILVLLLVLFPAAAIGKSIKVTSDTLKERNKVCWKFRKLGLEKTYLECLDKRCDVFRDYDEIERRLGSEISSDFLAGLRETYRECRSDNRRYIRTLEKLDRNRELLKKNGI